MRHDIRTEVGHGLSKVEKKALFKQIYSEVDSCLAHLKSSPDPIKKDNWRQIRKIAGEYAGNLYIWGRHVNFMFLEIDTSAAGRITVTLYHDGEPYDQSTLVETIRSGLHFIESSNVTVSGINNDYDGLSFSIKD
jgi:TRAP-type C4-dicarboxylate transport system substrate-binding protein